MKSMKKRIQLRRETIRQLGSTELGGANGGQRFSDEVSCRCQSKYMETCPATLYAPCNTQATC